MAFGCEPGDTYDALVQFFANGGTEAWVVRGDAGDLAALDSLDGLDVLCLPGARNLPSEVTAYCEARGVFLIADAPQDALRSANCAVYFPDLVLAGGRVVPPSGTVAGIYARIDPWVAPAGRTQELRGVVGVAAIINERETMALAAAGINAIRRFPTGIHVWGARTTSRDPEWRYVSVRRLALYLESSLGRTLDWVSFEPRDDRRVRAEVEDFMVGLFRRGALAGVKAEDSFFVQIDPEIVDRGTLTVVVGFAPLMPAEFVVVEITKPTLSSP